MALIFLLEKIILKNLHFRESKVFNQSIKHLKKVRKRLKIPFRLKFNNLINLLRRMNIGKLKMDNL